MKKTFKKFLCGSMAAAMLMGTTLVAHAATPFADVPGNAWYASYVDYAYNHKLMAGTSNTAFNPNQTMTRGMLVTVLHSIAEKPGHSGRNPFSDVGSSWYTNAVIWCYEHGIVAGTSATTFSPNSPVTREQMVAIMFKFAANNGLDTSDRADLSSYSDYNSISNYAKDAFSWAVAKGVISGTSSNTLSPKGQATRAQCAVVLQRYHELLNAKPQPAPTEPAPTEPQPTEPKPTVPAPTEPKPTEHTHNWVKKECNHGGCDKEPFPDEGTWVSTGKTYPFIGVPQIRCTECGETGHWEPKVICRCGYVCTQAEAEAAGYDIVEEYWAAVHAEPKEEEGDMNHSYDTDVDWIIDAPSADQWICTSCGEISTTNPN